VLNDVAEICRIARRHGARVLVDAAQLVARRKVEVGAWGIDYLALSAHKGYAPFGSGALVARRGLLTFAADEMERIRSSGEENVGGITALGRALVLLQRIGFDLIQEEERDLTARALRGLAQVPGFTIYGTKDPGSPRLARRGGVIAFNLAGRMAGPVAEELAERSGIGTRFGCHCAHLLIKRLLGLSRPLEQFQWLVVTVAPALSLPGVARVSLGLQNSEQDVDALVRVLTALADRTSRPRADVRQRIQSFVEARAKMVYGR
jgi:selenocysteine lyase/cysteine desulfurase